MNLIQQHDLNGQDQTNTLLATKQRQTRYNDIVALDQATYSRG